MAMPSIEAMTVDGRIRDLLVKMRGFKDADFAPRGKLRGRYIAPVLAIVAGEVNVAGEAK